MFSYLKGEIVDRGVDYVILDNGGIGYELSVSSTTLTQISDTKYVQLYTYLAVREDGMSLYGFYTKEEKTMYLKLLTVSGVGPKAALSVLSGLELNKLMVAILNKDIKTLSKIKGIGKKIAERIVLELKESIDATIAEDAQDTIPLIEANNLEEDHDTQDAIYALRGLGFTQAEAVKAVRAAKPGATDLQDLIAKALRSLY